MTPSPSIGPAPYYAVIFTNTKRSMEGYGEAAQRMVELAKQQPGYLGMDSVANGINGIFVSYWRSQEDILAWKQDPEHRTIQAEGRKTWYQDFTIRVYLVERAYDFSVET